MSDSQRQVGGVNVKKLLVAVLLSVVLSSLVSAQTPTPGGRVTGTNEHGRPGPAAPASTPGASAPSRPLIAGPLPTIEPLEGLDNMVPVLPKSEAGPHLFLLLSIISGTEQAKDIAAEALRLLVNPSGDEEFYIRGMAHYELGDYDLAMADFDKVLHLNPRHVRVYAYLGRAYLRRGDHDRAIVNFDKVIQIRSPQYFFDHIERGVAYLGKGEHDRAIADFDRAIQIEPRIPRAYLERGAAYFRKGDHGRAMADYSEAIRLNPKLIRAYKNRAEIYEKIGDKAKAQADREKAAELEKGHRP